MAHGVDKTAKTSHKPNIPELATNIRELNIQAALNAVVKAAHGQSRLPVVRCLCMSL